MSKEKQNKNRKRLLKGVISGNVLLSDAVTKQRLYLLFLVGLALFYIGFHYKMAATVREARRVEREVNNLQAEYATKSSELMRLNKQSEVVRMLRDKGITNVVAPKAPPKRIKQ